MVVVSSYTCNSLVGFVVPIPTFLVDDRNLRMTIPEPPAPETGSGVVSTLAVAPPPPPVPGPPSPAVGIPSPFKSPSCPNVIPPIPPIPTLSPP